MNGRTVQLRIRLRIYRSTEEEGGGDLINNNEHKNAFFCLFFFKKQPFLPHLCCTAASLQTCWGGVCVGGGWSLVVWGDAFKQKEPRATSTSPVEDADRDGWMNLNNDAAERSSRTHARTHCMCAHARTGEREGGWRDRWEEEGVWETQEFLLRSLALGNSSVSVVDSIFFFFCWGGGSNSKFWCRRKVIWWENRRFTVFNLELIAVN